MENAAAIESHTQLGKLAVPLAEEIGEEIAELIFRGRTSVVFYLSRPIVQAHLKGLGTTTYGSAEQIEDIESGVRKLIFSKLLSRLLTGNCKHAGRVCQTGLPHGLQEILHVVFPHPFEVPETGQVFPLMFCE